jgi:rRNA-processing protein CGR1
LRAHSFLSEPRISGLLLIYLQRRITALKDKRAAKEEKARYEKLAETMHRKRVERLKRKEKRNKMIKS